MTRLQRFLICICFASIPHISQAAESKKPNIVVILVDDMGFSDIGCYGSEIPTPNIDQLASNGARFTQFYNTGRCCPTRASLLTGLYSHQTGIGWMTRDQKVPGYRGQLNDRCVTLAEVLNQAGYFTAMTGKWHVGFNHGVTPASRGFRRSLNLPAGGVYGASNSPKCKLYLDGKRIANDDPRLPKNWYGTDLWTDYGIQFIDESIKEKKPFFLYLAHVAPHFPLQASEKDIARFRGKYKSGWDVLARERLKRQQKSGLIDPKWKPETRPDAISDWAKLTAKEKNRFDHLMAVYAAVVARMDQSIGNLVAALKERKVFDNTLILFMSDNGGNAEAGPNGRTKGDPTQATSSWFCGQSWAHLQNTPFRMYKHFNHEGGIATPLIAHWPDRIRKSRWERTPSHVIDIMATCIDVAGTEYLKTHRGKAILPLEGKSLKPLILETGSLDPRPLFWEHEGNAAIRVGDRKLVRKGRRGAWELFDMKVDRTEQHNLAKKYPEEVKKLKAQWQKWARRANVLPKPGRNQNKKKTSTVSLKKAHGNGKVEISGELKQWHKVTLTLDGPSANERDTEPNPFTDYRFSVQFAHESGSPSYQVPGYFAADGEAANSSAESGTKWRAHLSPDKPGKWSYRITFVLGKNAALMPTKKSTILRPYHGKTGSFQVKATDKKGRDFRARGRLRYVGKHYLQFAGSGEYFLKAGADAPETLLATKDFDGTITRKAPLKTWKPHVKDWRKGDPTWKKSKGKGLIGALNYLADTGCNAFSFLTYNAGGDGDNVWPFVGRDAKLHYDCSKLDQWQIVFDHAQKKGLYLHFKMQETEIDDNRHGKKKNNRIAVSLDGGELGVERRLYCRELIARFGHALALNWNLGEENSQTPPQQRAMAKYIYETDPYRHHIVVHTFPNQQDRVYPPLLGKKSVLTGASLQNGWSVAHQRTLKWVRESVKAGRPWVVANDEQNPAQMGVPPDIGYNGSDGKAQQGKRTYTMHDIRKYTLWGTLTAGGAGVEYYFGYKLAQNDLICEDWRSRDQSWKYCAIALRFFKDNKVPFHEMVNADELVDNATHSNSRYCLAKHGEVYVVYLPSGGSTSLDLRKSKGKYSVSWFDPRSGGRLQSGSVKQINGGSRVSLGRAPVDASKDWVVYIRK